MANAQIPTEQWAAVVEKTGGRKYNTAPSLKKPN